MNRDVVRDILAYLRMQVSAENIHIENNNSRINSNRLDEEIKARSRSMNEYHERQLTKFQSWIQELERSINEHTVNS